MTIGVTGVVWMPRGATVNSTTLSAGAGPVPLSAASPAWTAISESFADAGATLAHVMEGLRTGWEGVAADAALARIAPFATWAEQTSVLAAATAAKASTQAGAYTTAALAMPSLPEIATVKTAKTAAYTTGGVLNGSAAAAEAADRAMDIRAGLVMEGYEAASSVLSTPETFTPPPPLTNGATAGLESRDSGEIARRKFENDFRADPVGTIAAAATAFAQNPAVATAASQVGTVAGTVSGATSAAANLGGAVLGGVGAGSPALMGAPVAPVTGRAATATATAGVPGGGGGSAGAVASRAAGVGGGSGGARAALPDGWAQAGQLDGSGHRGGVAGGAGTGLGAGTSDGMRAETAATTARSGPMAGTPMGAHRGGADADEADRATPGYLRSFEHFADGRTVIPSVIGADLPEDGR